MDNPFEKVHKELSAKESEITLHDISILIGALNADSTKRLGRIERDLIQLEKGLRKASPSFSKALSEVRASK